MLKRGLVNDLARIPHSLDMSSPMMAFTVNAALKPLEALSRIVNLPPATPLASRPPAVKPKTDGDGVSGEPETTSQQLPGAASTSDSTRAQAVDEISGGLDAENTEQDVSVAAESLENLAENEGGLGDMVSGISGSGAGGGDSDDNVLDEIMDQHSQALVQALIVAAEHPSEMETDDTVHDSQMRTHNESEFMGADDAHYHGSNDQRASGGVGGDHSSDSDSQSGDDDSDEDEADEDDDEDDGGEEETEEEGEGEDDVEEEEEEETEAEEGEEEENTSGYGEDGDRYPEMLRDFLTRGAAGAGAGDVEDTLVFTYPDAENSAAGLGFGTGLGLGKIDNG